MAPPPRKNNRNGRNKDAANNPNFMINPAMLPQVFSKRSRACPLSGENSPIVDYKNIALLTKFVSERGKILPRRISSVSSKKQRALANAIKRARTLALLPYVSN